MTNLDPIRIVADVENTLTTLARAAGAELTEDPSVAAGLIIGLAAGLGPSAPAAVTEAVEHPSLRWVQLPSAGVETFADAMRARPEILWTSAKGCYARPVAEHALALTLAMLRGLPERVRATSWGASAGRSLYGLRVTVLGAGGIGSELLNLLAPFETRTTVVRRRATEVPGAHRTVSLDCLNEVLPQSDVLLGAAAETPQTRGLLDARRLALLPSDAVIVNVGRGSLIDTAALVAALTSGHLGGAALDVTDPEPLPDGHPLWTAPRCLITPHTADTLEMTTGPYSARVAANLGAFLHGTPPEGVVSVIDGY